MTTNNPSPTPAETLSEEALAEIERKVRLGGPIDSDIPALCQSLRAARVEVERLRNHNLDLRAEIDRGALCEECDGWEYNEDGSCRTFTVCGVCWNKRTAENAQAEAVRDQLSNGLAVRDAQLTALQSRLAQVEKDRDYWKERCFRPNKGLQP